MAVELTKGVGDEGLVVGLDFSRGMLEKAKEKANRLNLDQLYLVQANASQLPFKKSSFHGVTCSHAFYELKGDERTRAIDEVARVLNRWRQILSDGACEAGESICAVAFLYSDLLSWFKGCEEVSR